MNRISKPITFAASLLNLLLLLTSTLSAFAQEIAPHVKPGEIDFSFGIGGRITDTFMAATEIAIQGDNKIVIAGFGQSDVARFHANGTLDTSFGNGGKAEGLIATILGIAIQADGKILVAGFHGSDASINFGIARYNTNGTPDTSFGNGGKVTTDFFGLHDEAAAIAVQSDGRIVVGGSATINQSATDFALARYTANGTLDPTFGVGGKLNTHLFIDPDFSENFEEIRDLAIQPDGRIVAVGITNERSAYVRYLPNGSLDGTFGVGGKVIQTLSSSAQSPTNIILQPDGRILIGGAIRNGVQDFLLVRLLANGSLDPAFGDKGQVITDFAGKTDIGNGLALLSDGRILQVGVATLGSIADDVFRDFALVCYKPNGSLDPTFGNGGKVTTDFFNNFDEAEAVAIQKNGRAIVAGRVVSGQQGFGLTAYALTDTPNQAEPQIFGASINGKKLMVAGANFEAPIEIYVNGQKQKKTSNDAATPTNLVIAAKAGKLIAPGQTAMIQVKNTATGKTSASFSFTRPLS